MSLLYGRDEKLRENVERKPLRDKNKIISSPKGKNPLQKLANTHTYKIPSKVALYPDLKEMAQQYGRAEMEKDKVGIKSQTDKN